ncbi:BTAD domain-containing putative transcriptional regulator [Phytomonospora endophytica]|uniref:Putative ATPase/DNA-binding SARP family transcriptional activator n=1 Tax=Phytomonospora endophytica TaxID=714109 RepID=A0A841FV77_9ACTN|nr:BTAD domain-containing putative transcriptional regulator [Phytomonospora endophytica]MBB6037628.1 putative ATPase/DNA-binding SARP family transcriptional activator [Phytomonospora endophytica]GIG67845.1 SARP family transcriptional regulator [Phytomonospora endophytica]
MRITLLGPVQATGADGEPIGIGGPRSRALLALLALNVGRVVTADRLIDAMYGGDGSANALQSQVSRLRKAFGDADPTGLLQFLPGGYRLAVEPSTVDAHVFAELARGGARALSTQDYADAADLLRRAEALWRGPALADLDAPFARALAVRLDEQRLSATEDRVEAELQLGGDPRALVAELRELTSAHPLRERFGGQLMRALHADGQQAEALAVFERTRETLADRLGADPSPELAAVHVAILRGAPSPAAGTETPPTSRRPPAQLTSFVGRARELERITRLLETSRLVTLTGPGGAGKTRLAVEASQSAADVCFVELAGLEPGEEVSHAVFGALGMRESVAGGSADSLFTRIETALADRPVLLVLDNCEHVVHGAARFTDRLLRSCPRLRVLATSREALGITGEALAPVGPLPGPPGGLSIEDTAAYPAVALFTDRAKAARHDFALTPGNIADVAAICHALDGLPLAIELAAARLRSIPVADVAAHLDDRFRLLSRGSRAAEPRHQTLHAVVSWSWDLLDPAERDLAVRVSVFAGGFTLESAAQLSGLSIVECVDLLGDLADKSLLDVDGDRYRMLTTIRHFCAGRLSDLDGEPQAAHARHFHALLAEAEPHLRDATQLDWIARLATEHDNLYAALRWARDHDHALALSLVAYLVPYWWLRGLRASAIAHAEGLLARIDAAAPEGLVEEYVLTVLTAATYEPDAPHLAEHMRTVHELAGTFHPPFHHAYLMILWAVFAGPPDEEETPVEKLVTDLTGMPTLDPWVLAVAHLGIAFQYWNLVGDERRTRDAATECLRRFRAVGDRWGIVTALSLLGTWPDRDASRHLTEGIALAEELGSAEDQANLYFLRGQRRVGNDDIDGARADFLRTGELARHAGAREQIALADQGLAQLALRTGELTRARSLAETALAECPTGWMQTNQTYAQVKGLLGWIAEAEGDLDGAVRWHRETYALALELRQYGLAAAAVAGLASVALWSGDGPRAAWLLGAAEVLHETTVATEPNAAPASVRIHQSLSDETCAAAYHEATGLDRASVLAALEDERAAGAVGAPWVSAPRSIYSG